MDIAIGPIPRFKWEDGSSKQKKAENSLKAAILRIEKARCRNRRRGRCVSTRKFDALLLENYYYYCEGSERASAWNKGTEDDGSFSGY